MEEEIRLLIGRRLREERERLGFSQQGFADLGDASMRAEQDWERGASAPKADFLTVAARHGVDVLYVLTGMRSIPVESTLSAEESALLTRFRSGSPTLRGYLQEMGASVPAAGNTVSIGGDVGQSITGDATFSAPVNFSTKKK
jgi:transcriptional regulator with XRE-family HTH domain